MYVSRQMLHKDLNSFGFHYAMQFIKLVGRTRLGSKIASAIIWRLIRHELPDSIIIEERHIPSSDGEAQIRLRIYRPKSASGALPPMLYTHGGGYTAGSPEQFDGLMAKFIERRPCVIVAPAYRNALIKPYPAAFDDCYATLLWMRENAEELGINASKFIVAGHSAGGGLTAAVTLKVRDTKDVNIAFQMPIYPMIDDQQPNDPARYIEVPLWDTKGNAFGWNSYLKDLHDRNAEIPLYAAPARNTDYRDFPPTITFVGQYEPFYWETVDYVEHLKSEGIDVVFKVYEGCWHGFEQTLPNSSVGMDALAFTFDNYADFYDRYVAQVTD